METEKKMKNSLALTYEGKVDFTLGGIWMSTDNSYERLSDVVHRSVSEGNGDTTMRCRIHLTIDRLPDNELNVEVE